MRSNKRFMAIVPGDGGERRGPADKYKPEYCWDVREMGQKGMLPEEWVSHIGVTLKTLYNWADAYPEFEQAMHEAHWLCRAFWAQQARQSIQGVGMPPSVIILMLERRFGDMWGKNSINMHKHFDTRNEIPDPEDITPKELRDMNRDELRDRIRELEARRKTEVKEGDSDA